MHKYIVTWSRTYRGRNPYHYSGCGNIEPEYDDITEDGFSLLSDDNALVDFMKDAVGSNKRDIRYFRLADEIFPKIKSVLNLEV